MDRLIGSYRTIRLIGRGGMGEVWEAVDTRNGRRVALKLLPRAAFGDPDVERRFRLESELAAAVQHPNVLPIYDYEVRDRPFIVMPLIQGTDLASEIRKGPLGPERAVAIVEQVAAALDAAHRRGLRHRDVKPSNILLEPGARPGTDHAWLFDWGLAHPVDTSGLESAIPGYIVGTPAYLAPERYVSSKSDHRADVYSLAVVLYECLAGHKPFDGHDDVAVLMAHLREPSLPLPASIPGELRAVVAVGLAKDPDDRYRSAGELAEAARAALDARAEEIGTATGPRARTQGKATGPSILRLLRRWLGLLARGLTKKRRTESGYLTIGPGEEYRIRLRTGVDARSIERTAGPSLPPYRLVSRPISIGTVTVYTSNDDGEPLRNAVVDLLEVAGFEVVGRDDPVLGSFSSDCSSGDGIPGPGRNWANWSRRPCAPPS